MRRVALEYLVVDDETGVEWLAWDDEEKKSVVMRLDQSEEAQEVLEAFNEDGDSLLFDAEDHEVRNLP